MDEKVRGDLPDVLQEVGHGDGAAVIGLDGVVAGVGFHAGADGADEEVAAADEASFPELLQLLLDARPHLRLDVAPEAEWLALCFAADHIYRGGERSALRSTQATLPLCMDRPRAGDNKTGLDEAIQHRFPTFSSFVGVNDDRRPAGFEHTVHFLERVSQHALEEGFCGILCFVPRRLHDGLFRLWNNWS